MFRWIDGVRPPAGAAVQERYWIDGDWVRANVSAEHILPLIRRSVAREAEIADGFCLFLETPANVRDEPPAVGLTEDASRSVRRRATSTCITSMPCRAGI